ncbi:DNA polymerase-3 subunit epsilon [Pseudomonas linyingensis]|uniref:DNA polymerase-3 subunit epsilon n=1 Tax=Pseudomonas linyingensis TaxID=915471 RepID=A0A1H6ZAL2_9PSED|nr:3'-5' exonuclease [Pseudomonas linyingensis]SEJ45905.1 DNA polymerase-3 subunit epsilon [Pseudomonas linyingensis]
MTNFYAFDTETTGFPLFKEPSEDPRQPHIVDIAALLYNDAGELIDSFEAIIRPDGWTIPDEVAQIHGITHEMAMDLGIPEAEALDGFMAIHERAALRVAHNCQFDDRILRIALMRFRGEEAANSFRSGASYCTANNAKPVCQLPPTAKMQASRFRNTFKTPNLAEALKHLTGEDLVNAHRARIDAEACVKVYFALQKLQSAA